MSVGESSSVASKSKDGIPTWNGAAESFQAYQEAALLYEQTTPYQKRYLCGPKLQSALEGAALRLVVGKRPDWLSDNHGVTRLLEHLRKGLGRPQMPELTDLLNRYFRSTKRRANETMNEYVTRKAEVYVRAQQAMLRVQPVHGLKGTPKETYNGWPPPHRGDGFPSWTWERTGAGTSISEEAEADVEEGTQEASVPPGTNSDRASETSEARGWSWTSSWSGQQWGYSDWDQWSYTRWPRWERTTWDKTEPMDSYPELVPEFVQAWLLLADASLETSERNLILTAIQGDLSVPRVAQELRNHFPEGEIRKKEYSRKQQGFLGALEEEDPPADTDLADWESGFHAEENLTEEGWALWSAATQDGEEALAAIQQARKTLKNARERQKMVKLSRQYYKVTASSSRNQDSKHDEHITCLRCGQQGHRAASCPAPQPKATSKSSEMAPFVCYTDGVGEEQLMQAHLGIAEAPTTAEVVAAGKAIIDCGATKSLGSVQALEQVMRLSSNGVSAVDTSNQPVFGFGNSSEDRCLSTVLLNLKAGGRPGLLKVHALDKGSAPVLLSVSTLRSLGAIIDFAAGKMVLRAVDAQKLIALEQSKAGHLLLPLVGDILDNSIPTLRPVPSLNDFVQSEGVSRSPDE